MTKTAEKVMELLKMHHKVKAGTVLTSTELSFGSRDWDPSDAAALENALRELRDEGYVIITSSKGLELTEKGADFLFNGP